MDFFAPVHLIAYMDGADVKVDSSSFVSNSITGSIQISAHSWKSFEKTAINDETVNVTIPPHSSRNLWTKPLDAILDGKMTKVRL